MKISKKILIVGVLIAAVSILVILWERSSVMAEPIFKPKPSPTPEVLASGWYGYTDPDAGYSISYPPNSFLDVSEDKALEFKHVIITFPISEGRNYWSMQIIVYTNDERLPFQQFVEEKVYKGKSPKKGNDIPLTPTKFTGFEAAKMTMVPFDQAMFISAKNKIYFISLPYEMQSGNPPTPEAVEIYNNILDTLSIK